MGYINIFLSSPCKILIKNRQLVIQGEKETKVPLEDVNCLLIESEECVITSYALQAAAKQNVAVFVCGENHLPNGLMLPFNGYYRQLKTLKLQIKAPKPLQKQLWQKIITQKIINQAEVCALNNVAESAELLALSKCVNSGDTGNVEAVAANFYFKILFGKDFSRQKENGINASLNYGYSIVRGIIARTLAAYGLQPCIGIHHCNELNAFNLADDLIEPFRPVVDLLVFNNIDKINDWLDCTIKRFLFGIVNTDVLIGNHTCALSYAVELCVQSFLAALVNCKNDLKLPSVLPIKTHTYE